MPNPNNLIHALTPFCEKVAITGALRREEPNAVPMFLVIPKTTMVPNRDELFGECVSSPLTAFLKERMAGPMGDYQLYVEGGVQFMVATTTAAKWVSDFVRTTGPKNFVIEIYTALKGKGYRWVDSGFLKLDQSVLGPKLYVPKDEEDFFRWLGIPWTEPRLRKFGPVYPKDMPDDPSPITPDEMRRWRDRSRWVGSTCGGEAHEYTVRVSQEDEEMFCRVANTIYEYGYDGHYLRRSWRYLDLDGFRYFAVDYRIAETTLINRKPYFTRDHKVRPWVKNPKVLHRMSEFDPLRKQRHAASVQ